MPPVRYAALLAVASVTPLASGCGPVTPQQIAARAIRNHLPALVGPAKRYDVSVDADPFALSRGIARGISIHGEDVQVSRNLTLDELNIDARDIRYDKRLHRITQCDETLVSGAIGAPNLNRYLASTHGVWSTLTVEFKGARAVGTLPVEILQQTAAVKMTGHFTPDAGNPSGVDLVADSASVAGVPLPAALVDLALRRVNPVVDLSRYTYPVRVISTNIGNGRLSATGSVNIVR